MSETLEKPEPRSLTIKLGFPPSVNTMYCNNARGRHMSKRGKQYRKSVVDDVFEQHYGAQGFVGPVRASVDLIPPDRRKRDIDNYNKAIFDGLKAAGVYIDDDQIKELHVWMMEPGKESGCTVVIEEL